MLGAIIGDIVGSRFEFINNRSKIFDFFDVKCDFTDDSVMTVAVAAAILSCEGDYSSLSARTVSIMQNMGREYIHRGYGTMFQQWIYMNDPQPYNSYGNGAAMRVSACGFAAGSIEEAKELSYKVTAVTHNHPEGIKGAEATAVAIFLAKSGYDKFSIGDYIHSNYYKLDFSIDEIRDTYCFNETCQNTVPQAIMAFIDSTEFEDAIRNAISIGGDSDTLAAITGAIAEAYYGIPDDIRTKAMSYLDDRFSGIVQAFERRFPFAPHREEPDIYELSRFLEAQEETYDCALSEIRSGRKRTHWMWYIFPQISGLGYSDMAMRFGISCLDEAKAYMENPILSTRLTEITEALIKLETNDPTRILGDIDAMKLCSSLTLFALVSDDKSIFHRALDKFFLGQMDKKTLAILENGSR